MTIIEKSSVGLVSVGELEHALRGLEDLTRQEAAVEAFSKKALGNIEYDRERLMSKVHVFMAGVRETGTMTFDQLSPGTQEKWSLVSKATTAKLERDLPALIGFLKKHKLWSEESLMKLRDPVPDVAAIMRLIKWTKPLDGFSTAYTHVPTDATSGVGPFPGIKSVDVPPEILCKKPQAVPFKTTISRVTTALPMGEPLAEAQEGSE